MKNFILKKNPLILLCFALMVYGCSCSKKTPSSNTTTTPVAEPVKTEVKSPTPVAAVDSIHEDIYRFSVSFYSIGEGAEGQQIQKFRTFVYKYGQQIQNPITPEESHWGREGEVDFCMTLEGISPAEQQKFIDEVKKELSTARWVNYSENTKCKKGKAVRK